MLTFYDSQNQPLTLGERLGSGGEGTVYSCADFKLVAKIYHEAISDEKAEKLRWMAANKNEQLLKVAAWVVDVLQDKPGGKIVGFLMPNVKAKEIHELYSLKSRRVYFPEATWHFLIHASANLARAFYNLHKNAHVMGDVNHGNCVVLADGTVKLIDCDSYSIKTDVMRYACDVGVATHLAPELQGVNLASVEREDKHDNFGLAVIIFQLLFLGRHPFAGNYLGAEDKSIEDCIREMRFAYGENAARRNVVQPPGTLPLNAVSPRVAALFERAFTTDKRPEPREWIESLEDLSDNLEQCSLHPGHLFYKQNALCPWCEIETQTGVMLFPFVTTVPLKNRDEKPFDISTVENLIASFNMQSGLPAKLEDKKIYVPPAPELVKENQRQRNEQLSVIAIYSVLLLCAVLMLGSGCTFVLGIVAMVILYNRFGELGKMIRLEARDSLAAAQHKWSTLENNFAQRIQSSNVAKDLSRIRLKIAEYNDLQSETRESGDSARELSGAGAAKFNGNAQSNLPEKFDEKRRVAEHEISNLLASLRVGTTRVNQYQHQMRVKSQSLARELAQMESNVRFLGSNLPLGIILGLITMGIPIFNTVIRQNLSSNTSPPTGAYTQGISNANRLEFPVSSVPPKIGVFVPEENITDKEIAKLSESERSGIVGELIRQSDLALGKKDYKTAEKKLRYARRFDDRNILILNKFGNLFYDQNRYGESLAYLKMSKDMAANDDADFYIGMNYLQMRNYAAARDVFVKLTGGAMQNNATYYNLGLAYQGLKNYTQAIGAFQKALNFDPNDIESTYQMGICFSKIGDAEQVKNFYLALLEKDTARAERFKKSVGKSFFVDSSSSSSLNEPAAPTKLFTGSGNGIGGG